MAIETRADAVGIGPFLSAGIVNFVEESAIIRIG